MGTVVDPEPAAGAIPGAVSMTWTDPCDVEVRTAFALIGIDVFGRVLPLCFQAWTMSCLGPM